MNFPEHSCGLMFHHFHDDKSHIRGQGSISENEFEEILNTYSKKWNILSADEYLYKHLNHSLNAKDVCLTFDDGLKCQYDVALPVLRSKNIKAFWFIYSSPLEGTIERLELYRYCRFAFFKDIDEFYNVFYDACNQSIFSEEIKEKTKNIDFRNHLSGHSFYTFNDRKFRFIRDVVLGQKKYFTLMDTMLQDKQLDLSHLKDLLWMSDVDINNIHEAGHIVGLHSHTHPTLMESLDKANQKEEYLKNYNILKKMLKQDIVAMSHPCNSYSSDTLSILNELGIKIGFRSNWAMEKYSSLELPRIDHTFLINQKH